NELVSRLAVFFTFLFVATWPLFPVLIQWQPWPLRSAVAFVLLLSVLAWVLVVKSGSLFSAIVSSWLTLALTGLTCYEYTTSQMRM
ncbi:hypothetical protein JKP88DRAFT_151040, partial [Tribonema minus]